jgi:hypothetical protein
MRQERSVRPAKKARAPCSRHPSGRMHPDLHRGVIFLPYSNRSSRLGLTAIARSIRRENGIVLPPKMHVGAKSPTLTALDVEARVHVDYSASTGIS